MLALDALDTASVRRWSQEALAALEAHQSEIDALNVFPIPDADTGTNLVHTIRCAAEALAADPAEDAVAALRAFATGAILGALGNSGVIISQVLRSFADAADKHPACDAEMLRFGLKLAAEGVRAAVADPVEGTIITVAAAAASRLPDGEASLVDLVCAAVEVADAALQRTPRQLAVLGEAGVVDAGGRGFVLLLDALARVIGAEPILTDIVPARSVPSLGVRETGSTAFGYEVQYLLDTDESAIAGLRAALGALGDSVALAGTGSGTWNVHVHVNDVGAAIEAGIAAGRPHQVNVVRFADQHHGHDDHDEADRRGPVALIAIAPGLGLDQLFASEGVSVVDGSTIDEVVDAMRLAAATDIVLLPNVSAASSIAEGAAGVARAEGMRVAVVPTRSPVQALAAIAVHVAGRRFDDDVVAMAEAAAATRFAEVIVAESEALTSAGVCQAGDILGLIDGDVVEIGHDLTAVGISLVDRLVAVGAELLTVLAGADAPPGVGDALRSHVRQRSSLTEVQVYEVGQPNRPLIIGVE